MKKTIKYMNEGTSTNTYADTDAEQTHSQECAHTRTHTHAPTYTNAHTQTHAVISSHVQHKRMTASASYVIKLTVLRVMTKVT